MGFLLALAVIPGMLIMFYVYKKDSIEKEPKKLIIKLFLFGVLSVIPAAVIEIIASDVIYGQAGDAEATYLQLLIEYFCVVGLAEEWLKYIFLKKGSWKNKAFDYRFDAIVYAVTVSMGFAVFENIFYVIENGLGNALSRAVISIPGHASFAICMGIYYGQAKLHDFRGEKKACKRNLFLAVFMPLLMHGFFDFCLSADSALLIVIFFIYIIAVDIIMFRKIKKYSSEDTRISPVTEEYVPVEIYDNAVRYAEYLPNKEDSSL